MKLGNDKVIAVLPFATVLCKLKRVKVSFLFAAARGDSEKIDGGELNGTQSPGKRSHVICRQ